MSFLAKIRLYFRLLFDRKTPRYVKLLIFIGILYLIMPMDLLPDNIPFLGLVDDITIGSALIALALHLVPKDVKDKHNIKDHSEAR